jgi:hypothetical protein
MWYSSEDMPMVKRYEAAARTGDTIVLPPARRYTNSH